jgi:primosomal protein N' (replication factor Y) (superfamily II helicase)
MKLLTVVPISKGMPKDSLTYFTKNEVGVGTIVKIPLRKKIVHGLVIEEKNVEEMKSEIKSLSYAMRKIEETESKSFLTEAFVEGVRKIADYNASSVGATLFSLIPKSILEENNKLSFKESPRSRDTFHEINLLQADNEERFATYKSLVREEFAKNHSVFFCIPTIEDLLNTKKLLEKGIEKYTYVLHSGLTEKELIQSWKNILEEKHPVLVIATGSFLSIPRNDLGTIVLEKESSRSYKMQTRPYLDMRTVVEILAKEMKVRLVLGDIFLRVETLWEEKKGRYASLSPLKFRSLSSANCEIVDMKTPQDMKKMEFAILGEKIKNLIQKNIENNEHAFLFCARKGLYPQTVCSDCGTIVSCKNCNQPVILHSKKDKTGQTRNLFVCNHCGERFDAMIMCSHCSGWRLNPMGIGIDKVAEEIEKIFPNSKIFIFDKDHITTHKKAEKVRDLYYNTPGAICVGTEMALSYLNQKVENMAVVTLDSYFSIPDFQISEKVFHILLEMRSLAVREFLVQTRQEKVKIFEHAARGNLMDFYREEIEERKLMGFPPFNTYIKLTLEGEKTDVRKEMENITEMFLPHSLQIFDAFTPGTKNKHTVNGLLYLPKEKWPDKELLQKLRSLPPQFGVRIDPASLL